MKRDIAIIGMSGKYPKSDTIHKFWENLVNEEELIHFFDREELVAKGIAPNQLESPNFIKAAASIKTTNEFDYTFFNYTLDEARVMNPQTRMMHQLIWTGLEDAACDIERYRRKIGIFLGANKDLNWSLYSLFQKTENVDPLMKSKLVNPNFMASLIAYKLNLQGPCYFLDTACSTSLSAAHLACRSLLLNECGIAVVGGIRLLSYEHFGYEYHKGSIMSKDGHTKSFDTDSSGTVFSDGAGVVVLKRLEDAIKEKDHIYAVVKASAMNNDGNAKAGYTMPSVKGQSECIKLAQKIAGVSPLDISYIETHGTGTKIGDPIEIESLNLAFNNNIAQNCAIGSVKSNMGHADEAAGITGLIKTALALKHKVIPASLHYNNPNSAINFKEGPFFVNETSAKWEKVNEKPLTAGVSSFGIGGTNLHMILQESPIYKEERESKEYQLIRYSANSLESLEAYEKSLLDYIENDKKVTLSDLAYTLQVGRKQFDFAKYFVTTSLDVLSESLRSDTGQILEVIPKEDIVFMFPGQGSQYINMGKDLYEMHATFREILDEGFSLLRTFNNIEYKKILFPEQDSEHKINNTQYTQPLLFLVEYALAKLLIHLGIQPTYLIGHSLGEYTAACLSEVFSFEDALKIVVKRGELMASVETGEMVSVGKSIDDLDAAAVNKVSVAAINAPNTVVLSGENDEILSVEKYLEGEGIPFAKLKTSHAFHSNMMQDILEDFQEVLQEVKMEAPRIPFMSNTTGEFIDADMASSPTYWTEHIENTVYFEKGINNLIGIGHMLFIEVGPGKALTSFFNQSRGADHENAVLNTLRHPKQEMNDEEYFTDFLGKLWTNGIDIRWDSYYDEQTPYKISAPTYVFDTYDIPSIVSITDQLENEGFENFSQGKPSAKNYTLSWKYDPVISKSAQAIEIGIDYLLFADSSSFSSNMKQKLLSKKTNVLEVRKGTEYVKNDFVITMDPANKEHYSLLVEDCNGLDFKMDHILYCWELEEVISESKEPLGATRFNKTLGNVLNIIRTLNSRLTQHHHKITLISNTNCQVVGEEELKNYSNATATLLNILSQEHSNVYTSNIDIDDVDEKYIESVFKELESGEKYYKVAFRNGRRWVPYYQQLATIDAPKKEQFRAAGVYLFTGNLDEMSFVLIKHLLTDVKAHVFLLSTLVNGDSPEGKIRKKRLEILKDLSAGFHFISCNTAHLTSFSEEVDLIEKEYGSINAIVHSARNIDAHELTLVSELQDNEVNKHFALRVNSLLNINLIFKERTLDFVKVISSLSTYLGGAFLGSYASASTLLNDLVFYYTTLNLNCSILNLDRVAKNQEWIHEEEMLKIFNDSFKYDNVKELIISKRNINHVQNAPQKKETTNTKEAKIRRTALKSKFHLAESETEIAIVKLFEELFGVTGIGTKDNFFELGGDSLKGIPLINKINKEFSTHISLTDFFENPTVLQLATLIDNRKWLSSKTKTKNELFI